MNGNIGLESTVGKGSRFFLKFTDIGCSDEVTEQVAHFSWDECDVTFHGSSVMVVDDILPNRELALTYLSEYNLRLIEAENGEEAVSLAKLHHPDLILMDIRMPGLNGYQATELIRMVPEMSSVPVIALTASTMQREMEYRPNLFEGFLRKPVQKHLLVAELIRFLPHERQENKVIAGDGSLESRPANETTTISEEIKSRFLSDFAQPIEKQSVSIGIDELDELISNIEDFAALHQIKELSAICSELGQAADDFDFEKIQKMLQVIKSLFQ
jgi:CheY-like chemotaxis protein